MSNGQVNSTSTVQRLDNINAVFHFSPTRFTSCIPISPGQFNLTNPANYTNISISTPVVLEWTLPYAGKSCSNANTTLDFNVFLSSSDPPDFFGQTTNSFLQLNTLSDGLWFWTISASNQRFTTYIPEIRSFYVPTPSFCSRNIFRCVILQTLLRQVKFIHKMAIMCHSNHLI